MGTEFPSTGSLPANIIGGSGTAGLGQSQEQESSAGFPWKCQQLNYLIHPSYLPGSTLAGSWSQESNAGTPGWDMDIVSFLKHPCM